MLPLKEFAGWDLPYWAAVRLVSEKLGYSKRGRRGEAREMKRYTSNEVAGCLTDPEAAGRPSAVPAHTDVDRLAHDLCRYLNYRAECLESQVRPNLMNRNQAREIFEELRRKLRPRCTLPMNKQKGEKRHYAYLVGIINMLTEQALGDRSFDPEPRGLTVATKEGRPLRTFSRWMDGAYPSRIDPYAVWEVKEYYGTTTFGSRVADGVYETMLDGYQFAELCTIEGRKIWHYLMVDDYYTWWDCGRSYLCRIVDMMHESLVDEVLFGREVLSRWPEIVKTWP